MTTTTVDALAPAPSGEPEETSSSVVWALRDTGALTVRNGSGDSCDGTSFSWGVFPQP